MTFSNGLMFHWKIFLPALLVCAILAVDEQHDSLEDVHQEASNKSSILEILAFGEGLTPAN